MVISTEQLDRMLDRYQKTIERHFEIMGPTYGSKNLDLAKRAIMGAQIFLKSDVTSAMHLTGFVQGILLCEGLYTWEYLVSDDKRL